MADELPHPDAQFASAQPAAPPRSPSYGARPELVKKLTAQSRSHLVFVRYADDFSAQDGEWVYNASDLQASSIVVAHDLGDAKNASLVATLPGRAVWRVHVERHATRLEPYAP